MEAIAREYNVRLQDCAFIGDGKNDVHLAKEVGVSISFNGAKELEVVSTHRISQSDDGIDFKAVLQHL
jgi:phosphoserine phosphatase